ncbi:hypothetical protein HDU97_004579 [Phlyctochytrium planicorne]|nr:hypothetical protein HDU97_004579 [Phlyctochytrium planicorne]
MTNPASHPQNPQPRTQPPPTTFLDSIFLFFRRIFVLQLALTIYLSYKIAQVKVRVVLGKSEEEGAEEAPDLSEEVKEKKRIRREKEDEVWERVHERNAKRAYKAIINLQGLWIKAGQYLSTRADVLPAQYVSLLKTLQDAVPPKPSSVTVETIRAELGIESLEDLFESFVEEPLATASIATVCKAVLMKSWREKRGLEPNPAAGEKEEVVVKVQHKGIGKRVVRDLEDLGYVVGWVGWMEPKYDFGPIVREWSNEVPKELDFLIEARNTTEIRDAIQAHNDLGKYPVGHELHLDCGFADPIWELTTERVMVMTYVDGFKIMDKESLEKENVDMNAIVQNVIKSYAFQIYVLGFWNSDPHPGNFLVAKRPTSPNSTESKYVPILLDFGLTKRATRAEVVGLSKILLSAQNMDLAGLVSGLQEIGLGAMMDGAARKEKGVEGAERSMEVIQFIFRKTSSIEESKAETEALSKKNREREKEEKRQEKEEKKMEPKQAVSRPADAIPGVLVFFSRVIALLRGLCVSLDTRIDYLGAMAPFAKHFLETSSANSRFGYLDGPKRRTPISTVDAKVAEVLKKEIEEGRVLGAQVVVFRNGELVVDGAAGVMGVFDPRPVEIDSLFPVFSCTKAITAASAHLLIQQGKLRLSDTVASYWPEFVSNMEGKEVDPEAFEWKSNITVAHLLSHQSGLQDAGQDRLQGDAFAMTEFDEMVKAMERARPHAAPGTTTSYHFLSFGWLVGGLVQKVAGKPFGEVAREMLDGMGVGGLGYVGVPVGVEARFAALHWDAGELREMLVRRFGTAFGDAIAGRLAGVIGGEEAMPSMSEMPPHMAQMGQQQGGVMNAAAERLKSLKVNPMLSNPTFFNHLRVRRSVVPAASGNFSARGLALFYAHLLACEKKPTAGPSLPIVPTFPLKNLPPPTKTKRAMRKKSSQTLQEQATKPVAEIKVEYSKFSAVFEAESIGRMKTVEMYKQVADDDVPPPGSEFAGGFHIYRFSKTVESEASASDLPTVVRSPSPHDPFTPPQRSAPPTKKVISKAFGHSGLGGSFAFAHPESGVSVAVVINKLSLINSAAIGRKILEVVAEGFDMGDVVAFGLGDDDANGSGDVTMNPF